MKKTVFDFKLYREAFNQLKLPGILFSVLTTLFSLLAPFTMWISYLDKPVYNSPQTVDFSELTPLLALVMFLMPFVMCKSVFSFLNKRKASDFYHSIPNTRSCIFISFSAAALSWVLVTVLSTVICTSAVYILSPATTLSLSFIPGNILFFFTGSLFIFACTAFAMSVTGTSLSNFVLTGIILFFPRYVIMLFAKIVNDLTVITSFEDLSFITDPSSNIPFNTVFKFFFGSTDTVIDFNVPSIIYTFAVALVYLIIAGILFNVRKSEAAEKSAPNKALQHIYRCLLTIPFSLLIPFFIFNNYGFSYLFITAVFCLMVYYTYELISTKKFKALLSATPVLLAIVAFDVIFALSVMLTQQNVLSFQPSAQDIKGVYLSKDSVYSIAENVPYNKYLLKDLKLENEEINEIVSKSLKNTIEAVENKTYNSLYQQNRSQKITIQTNDNKKESRLIFFSYEDYEKIYKIASEQANYKTAVSSLPPVNSETILMVGGFSVTGEQKEKLWELYSKEFSALDTSLQAYHNYSYSPIENPDIAVFNFNLGVSGYYKTKGYLSEFRITSKTPETLLYAAQIINSFRGSDYEKSSEFFFDERTDYSNFSADLRTSSADRAFTSLYISLSNGKIQKGDFTLKQSKRIFEIFDAARENPINPESFYCVYIRTGVENENSGQYSNYDSDSFVSLTDEQQQEIDEIIKEYRESNGITVETAETDGF